MVKGILYPFCIPERTECSCTSTILVQTATVCRLAVKIASPYLCWAENPQILAQAFPEEEGLEGGTRSIDPRRSASLRPGPADVPEGHCISLEALLETKVHSIDANLFE